MSEQHSDDEVEQFQRYWADLEAGRIKPEPSRDAEIRAYIEANLTPRAREAMGLPPDASSPITPHPVVAEAVPPASGPVVGPALRRAAASPASPGAAAHCYRFPNDHPVFHVTFERASSAAEEVLPAMLKQVSELRSPTGTPKGYMTIRPVFCALSLALNQRRVLPPRIRDTRRLKPLPKTAKRSVEDHLLSNDRQVIDLHWLHCTSTVRPEARWAKIFDPSAFNFDLASAFVGTVGSAENKVNALRLPRRAQIELAVIQSNEIYGRWRHATERQAVVERAITDALSDPRSRLRAGEGIEPILPHAYLALRLADKCSPTMAAHIMKAFRWAGDADTQKMSACKRWLKAAKLLDA
jgi:hypothetical protein